MGSVQKGGEVGGEGLGGGVEVHRVKPVANVYDSNYASDSLVCFGHEVVVKIWGCAVACRGKSRFNRASVARRTTNTISSVRCVVYAVLSSNDASGSCVAFQSSFRGKKNCPRCRVFCRLREFSHVSCTPVLGFGSSYLLLSVLFPPHLVRGLE